MSVYDTRPANEGEYACSHGAVQGEHSGCTDNEALDRSNTIHVCLQQALALIKEVIDRPPQKTPFDLRGSIKRFQSSIEVEVREFDRRKYERYLRRLRENTGKLGQ